MAKDTIELLEHVGWTDQRQLHVIGVSMGGMDAEELALKIPDTVASLSLIQIGPRIFNTVVFFENLRAGINVAIPRAVDVQYVHIRAYMAGWLNGPDAEGHFPTNGDRFAAQEVKKRQDVNAFFKKGFLCYVIPGAYHHKVTRLKGIGSW